MPESVVIPYTWGVANQQINKLAAILLLEDKEVWNLELCPFENLTDIQGAIWTWIDPYAYTACALQIGHSEGFLYRTLDSNYDVEYDRWRSVN